MTGLSPREIHEARTIRDAELSDGDTFPPQRLGSEVKYSGTEEDVDRINKMVIVIQANEHPPPHFHVRYEKENASFAISDGTRLPGVKGLEKFVRNIKKWWKKNLCVLVNVWNDTRPTDCVVGPMEIPEECKEKPAKA